MLDTKALAEATALIVREHVAQATAPLIERIAVLEARPAQIDPAVLERAVAAEIAKLPPARDGVDVDRDQLAVDIGAAVERAIAQLPVPLDGKSVTIDEVRPLVDQAVASAVAELPAPRDGLDADPAAIDAAVSRAVAALPAPRDGASVTVEDLAPTIDAAVQRAVGSLPKAKDGIGLAGALIDRHGALVVTLTDGTTRDLGGVVGKDADMPAIVRAIDEKVAALPPAVNGIDGFGFDDLTVEQSGERSFVLRFTQGERSKEFSFDVPVVIDRGVYKDGATYAAGDGVTWAGSYWIAQKETASKPDSGDGFRLAVKRGRDGKDLTNRA
jgi:hypothetical protein